MLYALAVVAVIVSVVFAGKGDEIVSSHLKKGSDAFRAVGAVEKFSSLKSSENLQGYAVYRTFGNSNTVGCVGSANFIIGLKLNYCIPENVDPNTKIAHSSTMYTASSADKLIMTNYVNSGNCTGDSGAQALNTGICYGSSSWSVKGTSQPWQSFGPGTVTEIFDSTQACAGSDSGYTFLMFADGYCVVDNNDTYNSYTLTGCNGKSVDTNYYGDEQCQQLVRTMPSGLGECIETTSNSLPAWVSRKCSM